MSQAAYTFLAILVGFVWREVLALFWRDAFSRRQAPQVKPRADDDDHLGIGA
jgi:hypothetical protein